MSESETEQDQAADDEATEESVPTGQLEECQRCGREQGLVGKYNIWLCRQCFREISRGMGFKKYS
ncbi:SSU ribosomal protein S14P [Halomicrobium zhouii]|jgi:small subunit ribosomal protein S14|uniref:Small ribosomal subunit protein uS14 n=1 Tax=Halomicrobium zhouii TaxID=767519 RepID=A0A1I6KRM3_9EURY|nr:30S ribosomal protein S14 [Halomicrobium zhouii]MCU4798887.1 30S ribosomal protein S14 [Halobacteria archaeon HArc-gm2]SFR93882.1 SSU ribosomal protein S14P [Halomicrobium zhouii]